MTRWLLREIGGVVIGTVTYGALGAVLHYGSWMWAFQWARFEHGPYPSYLGDFGRTFHLTMSFFAAALYLVFGGNMVVWIMVILCVCLLLAGWIA